MQLVPFTERTNDITENIDLLSSSEISQIISSCEQEIFGGYGSLEGLLDSKVIEKCYHLVNVIRTTILLKGYTNIVLVGSGTSGRICRLIAKELLSEQIKDLNILPIIAGGINALVRARPNMEDSFESGEIDFLRYTAKIDRSNCFFIGISCGLSANYVIGSLAEYNKFSSNAGVIIGFNTLEQSPINISSMNLNFELINPIIGPEAITGSVRMKGGTASMILIYSIIKSVIEESFSKSSLIQTFLAAKKVISGIHKSSTEIGKIIQDCGNALNNNRGVHIVGSSQFGSLCIYDSAECTPTFGAKDNQLNGYSENGLDDLVFYDFEKKSTSQKEISLDGFVQSVLPKLSKEDVVILIYENSKSINRKFKEIILNDFVKKNIIQLKTTVQPVNFRKNYVHNNCSLFRFDRLWKNSFQKLLFIRSLLVQISTGAFIINGKVFNNLMIDLRITNKKLFRRAIEIINVITNFDKSIVETTLIRNINALQNSQYSNLAEVISKAAYTDAVVPITILTLFYPDRSLNDIKTMLNVEPLLRKSINSELFLFKNRTY